MAFQILGRSTWFCNTGPRARRPLVLPTGQFLGPETVKFCQFLVSNIISGILANKKRRKQFEQALDYV